MEVPMTLKRCGLVEGEERWVLDELPARAQ